MDNAAGLCGLKVYCQDLRELVSGINDLSVSGQLAHEVVNSRGSDDE